MKIKAKLIAAKNKVVDFLDNHETVVLWSICAAVVGGAAIYFKGAMDGTRTARAEWDFGNATGEWAVIMEDNGDYRTALPMAAIKEVMDKHKAIEWNNSMWKR